MMQTFTACGEQALGSASSPQLQKQSLSTNYSFSPQQTGVLHPENSGKTVVVYCFGADMLLCWISQCNNDIL